jgi:glycosyltransferase involved in cell wall biosynthesis
VPLRADAPSAPRVCFVNLNAIAALASGHEQQTVGGEEVQHALLASMLASQGWPVRMVTHDLGQPDGTTMAGVRVHGCYRPSEGAPGLRFLHPRWTGLHAALRRADADIYYTSCAGALIGQVAWFVRRHGRRMVFRIASDTDCDPRRLLIGTARDRWLYHYGLRRCDAVLAQTPPQVAEMRRHYGIESSLAPMLVDVPRDPGTGPRDIDVLWVANLRALKRPELLVEAARRLPAWRFHLVGGEVATEPEVAAAVARAARGVPNLTLHGRLGYPDTLALFSRARLFASTSRIEGFPNTFLQAWAHGVPSVSFFDPDGVVERQGLGRVVAGDDALVPALAQLLADSARHAHASQACRDHMLSQYRRDALLSAYLRTFRSIHRPPLAGPEGQPCPR